MNIFFDFRLLHGELYQAFVPWYSERIQQFIRESNKGRTTQGQLKNGH